MRIYDQFEPCCSKCGDVEPIWWYENVFQRCWNNRETEIAMGCRNRACCPIVEHEKEKEKCQNAEPAEKR